MADRRLGESDGFGEVTHACLAPIVRLDKGEEAKPSRVSQGLHHAGELSGGRCRERFPSER